MDLEDDKTVKILQISTLLLNKTGCLPSLVLPSLKISFELLFVSKSSQNFKYLFGLFLNLAKYIILNPEKVKLNPHNSIKLIIFSVIASIEHVTCIDSLYQHLNFLNSFVYEIQHLLTFKPCEIVLIFQTFMKLVDRFYEFEYFNQKEKSQNQSKKTRPFFQVDLQSKLPNASKFKLFGFSLPEKVDQNWKEKLRSLFSESLKKVADRKLSKNKLDEPNLIDIKNNFQQIYSKIIQKHSKELTLINNITVSKETKEEMLSQTYYNSLMLFSNVILGFTQYLNNEDRCDLVAIYYNSIIFKFLILKKQKFQFDESLYPETVPNASTFNFFEKFVLKFITDVFQFFLKAPKLLQISSKGTK